MNFPFAFCLSHISIFLLLTVIFFQIGEGENVCLAELSKFFRIHCFSDLRQWNFDLYDVKLLNASIECSSWCSADDNCSFVFFDTRYRTSAIYRLKQTRKFIYTQKPFLVYHAGDDCDVVPEPECYLSGNGRKGYSGRKTTTIYGITCQRWDLQSPHDHDYTQPEMYPEGSVTGAEHFCRDPGNDGYAWCYSMKDSPRYEKCGIPDCVTV